MRGQPRALAEEYAAVCGRYSLTARNPAALRERFGLGAEVVIEPRFNIAPGQDVPAVTTDRDGRPRADELRWGLVPHWSKSPASTYKTINARAETLDSKPAFREAFARRRCLVIADGFFEWQPQAHVAKQPWWITLADGQPFAFAGLWETWRPEPDAPALRSCAIVTTTANAALKPIHDRMPVILAREAEDTWLAHGTSAGELRELLQPPADMAVALTAVSTAVNDVANDSPECVTAVRPQVDEPSMQPLF